MTVKSPPYASLPVPPEQTQLVDDAERLSQTAVYLSWLAHRRLAQDLAELRLTVPQFTALAIMRARGPLSMSELAQLSQQVSATMTGIVDRLLERDLVSRECDPTDRRSWRVSLRPEGERLLSEAEACQQARLARWLGLLAPADRREALRLMQVFLELLADDMAGESKGP